MQSRRRHRPPPPFPTTAATAPDLALLASLSPLKSVSFNCIIAGPPPWLALFFLATPPLPPPPPLSSPPPRRHLQRAQVASAGHMSLLPRRRFDAYPSILSRRRFLLCRHRCCRRRRFSPISDEYPSSFDEYPSPFDGYSSSALPTLYSAASDPFGADASADVTSSGLVEGPDATHHKVFKNIHS